MHSIGGHRHGIDAIRFQIITMVRWANPARRLQSQFDVQVPKPVASRLSDLLRRGQTDATAL